MLAKEHEDTSIAVVNGNKEWQTNYKFLLANRNILLVEDNEINQLVAKDILEKVGINVSMARNGYEAIRYVRLNKFDVVLMDVQMPTMDGYEATKILRKTYSSLELPIIAMTANALKGDREKNINFGMNDYISKPINPEILFEILVKCLNGKSIESIKSKEKPIKESLDNEIQILDIEKTLLRFGNKKDFYKNLLKLYESNYRKLAKELSNLIVNNQSDEAKRFIHSLKSVTGNIGAMKLNNFITQFGKQYGSYNEEVITENLKMLYFLNEELLNEIAKFISINDSKEKFSNANFDVYRALEKLLVVLKKARAKEIKESMNYLVINIEDTGFITQINEIKKLVDHYHFKEAKVMVEELMQVAQGVNNG